MGENGNKNNICNYVIGDILMALIQLHGVAFFIGHQSTDKAALNNKKGMPEGGFGLIFLGSGMSTKRNL